MKKHCLTLDLRNDPELINQYLRHHENVWPEVLESIESSGIIQMEIFHVGDRLFMLLETSDDFSLEKKGINDLKNTKVQEWEQLMDQYQRRLSFAKPGEKWVLMKKIFDFNKAKNEIKL
jgi:L-rhamnose mutarotase